MSNYSYRKKPENVSLDIKLNLINMQAWGVKEIQLYLGISQQTAIKIRNEIRKKYGTAPYEKNKVLVKNVLKKFDTTIDERLEVLKNSLQITASEIKSIPEEKKVQNV